MLIEFQIKLNLYLPRSDYNINTVFFNLIHITCTSVFQFLIQSSPEQSRKNFKVFTDWKKSS